MEEQRLVETVFTLETEDGFELALSELHAQEGPSEGPAFLLVHGFAQNRLAFTLGDIPAELLRRGARVFFGELRGHGRSAEKLEDRDYGFGMAVHLEQDLPALVRGVRAQTSDVPVHYVGHSMGGILGYALATTLESELASLTTLAAPVVLGMGRPSARRMATLAKPLVFAAPKKLATDRLIRVLRSIATLPEVGGVRGQLRAAVRLANPEAADRKKLRQVLVHANAESRRVLLDLIDMARTGRSVIGGVDLVTSVRSSRLPIAAVIGSLDPFGDQNSVSLIAPGAGPRKLIELDGVGHVDITLGRSVPDMVHRLWGFLFA